MSGAEPWLVAALLGLALCACTSNGPGEARPAAGPAAGPTSPVTAPSGTGTARGPTAEPARGTATLVAGASALHERSAAGTPLELRVTVRNGTDRTLELLLWNTPFEETPSADVFTVTLDGERVPYGGRLVKRAGPPPAGAYRRLAPGEQVERVVDLARDYPVDRPGTYRIRFTPPPVAADGGPVRLAGDGREIVVERSGR